MRINKTLIFGLLFGIAIIATAIANEIQGMSAAVFLHPVAILIVFGGSAAAAFISLPMRELQRVFTRTYYVIAYPKDDVVTTLKEIIRISVGVNKDVLYMEKQLGDIRNMMLREGLALISMGFKTEDIRRFLEIKKEQNESALAECSIFYFSMAKMGPAFGLLGTLVGLIILLYYHMGSGDMSKVASSMGVALTATLYGVGISNMIFAPLGDYLQYNAERGAAIDNMVVEAVVQIKERRHPVYLMQALRAFLPREDYGVLDGLLKQELASSKAKTSENLSAGGPKAS